MEEIKNSSQNNFQDFLLQLVHGHQVVAVAMKQECTPMRLVTFEENGQEALGAWIDGDQTIVKLGLAAALNGSADPAFENMQAFIEAGPRALEHAYTLIEAPATEACISTAGQRILSPLPRPVQLRDFLTFPSHVRGCRKTIGEIMIERALNPSEKRAQLEAVKFFEVPDDFSAFPVYYICNRMAVSGPDEAIDWPKFSSFIDYELEFAAVIGKQGKNISKAAAGEYIFGYTVYNDWSARDEQTKAMASSSNVGPNPGKDFANTLGPCIVTADELPSPYSLSMKAYQNGDLVSAGSSDGMHFRFDDLIEHLTRSHAIYPGEVIGSGTVGGGCSLETRRPIFHGDVIELEVEGIGRLRNRVHAPHVRPEKVERFSDALATALQMVVRR